MMGRREGASRRGKKAGALEALEAARAGRGARVGEFQVRQEEAVFDEVGEEDYAALVEERREAHGGFVVDDGGEGYQDLGEEEDWGTAGAGAEEAGAEGEGRGGKRGRKRKERTEEDRLAAEEKARRKDRLTKLLLAKNKQKKQAAAARVEDDAALDDILGDLGDGGGAIGGSDAAEPASNPFARTVPPPPSAAPLASIRRAPATAAAPVPPRGGVFAELHESLREPETAPTAHEEMLPPAMEEADGDAGVVPAAPMMDIDGPAAPEKPPAGASEEPVQAPASVPAPALAAPDAAAPAATAWDDLVAQADLVEKAQAAKVPAAAWVDDGNLPLEGEMLPMYLQDIHEERGAAYLIGRVPVPGGGSVSCCAAVGDLVRNLFVVPRPEVVQRTEELHDLEATWEQEGRTEDKMALLKHLHALLGPLKAEVRQLLKGAGISTFTMVPVRRSYAFEEQHVPRGRQWVLKVKYPASQPRLSEEDCEGGDHFAAIFGANTPPLETLVLKRRLLGPLWINLKQPTRVALHEQQVSWCKLEVKLGSPKNIVVPTGSAQDREVPQITVAALNLKTFINPQTNASEIVIATVMYLKDVRTDGPTSREQWNNMERLRHFSVVRRLENTAFPVGFEDEVRQRNASTVGRLNGGVVLSQQNTERALMANLLARLKQLDPDVLVGHNISGFDLDVLLRRMEKLKVPNWSRIGRLRRTTMPKLKSGGGNSALSYGAWTTLAGRLVADTYVSSKEFLGKEVDYSLPSLAKTQLNEHVDSRVLDVQTHYRSAKSLFEFVSIAERDAWLSLGLMFHLNALPLSRQIANLSGTLWGQVLKGGRAGRIENLLLHEFYSRKFIVPDKKGYGSKSQKTAGRQKAAYAGGLVLEPKKGLYNDAILLLDFNSLYPSIIQEYNICFTTVDRSGDGPVELPAPSENLAVLPTVIQKLVQRRRAVKQAMKGEKNSGKKQQMDIRQMALKLTANSMYGCLGFTHSRFHAKELAELVTKQGRDILQNTVDMVQGDLNLEVIYGDTDSIMVNTKTQDIAQIRMMGANVKKAVNKTYRLLEIEMDGIFKRMLLLKKKKYAAITLELGADGKVACEKEELKGLDIVRRDWCPLAKDAGGFALQQILSDKPTEDKVEAIHNNLRQLHEGIEKTPPGKFILTKALTKNPKDYPDGKNQAHVQVALRKMQAGRRDGVSMGQTVQYLICRKKGEEGETGKGGLAQRAYGVDEYRQAKGDLVIDYNYYLSQQVHPVVLRLCEPIEETDAPKLANCLGLDASRYHSKKSSGRGLQDDAGLISGARFDDEDLYKECEPLRLRFPGGGGSRNFPGVKELLKPEVSIAAAQKPEIPAKGTKPLSGAQLANLVSLQAHQNISRYYDCWIEAEDVDTRSTRGETRSISLFTEGDSAPGTLAADQRSGARRAAPVVPKFDDQDLYLQLCHYWRLLDKDCWVGKGGGVESPGHQREIELDTFTEQAASVARTLKASSAFGWVDLQGLWNEMAF